MRLEFDSFYNQFEQKCGTLCLTESGPEEYYSDCSWGIKVVQARTNRTFVGGTVILNI